MPRSYLVVAAICTFFILISFSQIYLFVKFKRWLHSKSIGPGSKKICLVAALFFFASIYIPLFGKFFISYPSGRLSRLLLYILIYTFSVWSFGSLFTSAILAAKDAMGAAAKKMKKKMTQEQPDALNAYQLSRRKIMKVAFRCFAFSPLAVSSYGTFYERNNYELVDVKIAIKSLPEKLRGMKIALLTDIHAGPFMRYGQIKKYARVVNSVEPDLIVHGGDFISFSDEYLEMCVDALSGLKARYGMFGCLGNHENWLGADQKAIDAFDSIGVKLLRNDSATISVRGSRLNIIGIDDIWWGKADLGRAMAGVEEGAANILMSHNPDFFPKAAGKGIDLTLSGHYHGGQIKFELLGLNFSFTDLLTRYVEGLFKIGDSKLYVSRGIGTTGPPLRINATPEITLIRLI